MITFGIGAGTRQPTQYAIQIAKLADTLGFDYFRIPDENPTPPHRDVWVNYAAILFNTQQIKVMLLLLIWVVS